MRLVPLSTLVLLAAMVAKPAAPATGNAEEPVRFAAPWTSPYRVDRQWPHHLVNDDGRHLFIMCRTGWAYFGCKDPEGFLDRTRKLGCNVIRVTLEGQPYFKDLGIELWPWGGTRKKPDFTAFNARHWKEVERRVKMAGDRGIGIDLVLYFTLKPKEGEIERHRPYWQEAIKRLGKYANILTWEIHNEYTANEKFQDAAGEYFARNDPFGRPVCSSAGTTRDALWPTKKWMHLAINHSCTGSGQARGRDEKGKHTLDGWYLTVARNTRSHGKPAFCNESGREKRHNNDDGVHRRKQGWLWTMSGCFWTWHSWDGCEGIDAADYRAPGSEFVPMYAKFWSSLPFWTLSPDENVVDVDQNGVIWTVLADAPKSLVVAYLCVERSGTSLKPTSMRLTLPAGSYRLSLIRPSDLKVLEERNVSVSADRSAEITLSAWTDDLLVRIDRHFPPGDKR